MPVAAASPFRTVFQGADAHARAKVCRGAILVSFGLGSRSNRGGGPCPTGVLPFQVRRRPMGGSSQHGSKLFHTIVMVGAAFGAACGGATQATAGAPSDDASNDALSDAPGEAESAVGKDVVAEAPFPDAGSVADGAPDAPGAPDANACAAPGMQGRACSSGLEGGGGPYCCNGGACFPCFV